MPSPAEPAVNFDSVLDRLRDESLRHFASPHVTMERRRLHVRPFSQVLEVEIETGGRAIGAFVKILKPRAEGPQELEATRRNVAREFEVTSRVHDRFAPHLGLSAPRPIACYPELLALVTERVEGVSLQQLLSRARAFPSKAVLDELSQTLRRVGAWIRAFQAFDGPPGHVSLDEMRGYLDKRLQPLADGHVIDPGVRLGLLRHFDELAARVSESDLEAVPIHADFSPENVLIHNGEVSVLDFTMAKRGPRYLDLSQMFVHLDLLKAKPWFRPAVVDSLLTALLAGFDPTLRTDHPLFQLLLLQDIVCHLRQMQLDRPALPARVYSEFLRRRHLAWLMAQGAAPVAGR